VLSLLGKRDLLAKTEKRIEKFTQAINNG